MKKTVVKKITPLSRIEEVYHEEVIVEPAKRLLEVLLKTELKEKTISPKIRKSAISSR